MRKAKKQSKYLGMPLINGRVTKDLFNDLISKMDAKLNVWYLKYLSMARRVFLINSTLQTMPFYCMIAFLLPKNILNEISRKMKNFFGMLPN